MAEGGMEWPRMLGWELMRWGAIGWRGRNNNERGKKKARGLNGKEREKEREREKCLGVGNVERVRTSPKIRGKSQNRENLRQMGFLIFREFRKIK